MQHKLLFLVITFIFSSALASAPGNMRVGGDFGFGSSAATRDGIVRTETPFAFAAFVDYTYDSRITIGAEHERSFAGGSTAIGMTGISGKYYYMTPQPQIMANVNDEITSNLLVQKNIVPYLGLSVGFAQASFAQRYLEDTSVLVVGAYLTLKAGVEYPISGRWGSRGEFVYGTTLLGAGQAEVIHLLFGIYYFL